MLLPQVAARFRERLITTRNEPEKLHEYLKAYLMLGDPNRLDKEHVAYVADVEFGTGDDRPDAPPSLATHFRALLDQSSTLRPVALDAALIAQARSTINTASVPRIIYNQLQRRYAEDTARAIRLDQAAGIGGDQVIRRRSGVPLSEPIPAIYSRTVFNEITGVQSVELIKQFATDSWVWGEGSSASNPIRLASDVIGIYERDYSNTWNNVLADLELVPFTTLSQASKSLEILAGPTSPLRGIIAVVVDNTRLVSAPEGQKPAEGVAGTGQRITEGLGKLLKPVRQAAGASTVPAGTIVTAQFQPIHRLMEGEPGQTPLDRIITSLAQVHLQMQALTPGFGNTVDPNTVLSNPALREQLQALQQEALALPPALRALVSQVGRTAEVSVMSGVASGVERQFEVDVLEECRRILTGRYPFTSSGDSDVPLADFGRLFGYGGLFDTFFQANLRQLVDTSQRPWTWRPGTVGASNAMLRKIEEAARVRELFFQPGSSVVGLRFTAMLGSFDPGAQRFFVDFEGLQVDSRNQQRFWTIVWPGQGAQLVTVNFEQRFGGRPIRDFHGPWALFRMIDASSPHRENDTRLVLTPRAGNMSGQLIIQVDRVDNPFTDSSWRRFTCEP